MAAPLPFTGERFTPECAGGIWYEHWHRYVLARSWVAGKTVLDAACGEGYGSAFLSQVAGQVTGVDLSATAIAHARNRYGANRNLDYLEASATKLPLPDASMDVVVSFETIEHLQEQEAMLAEFRRVLRPDGFLILSAPNRLVYSDEKNYRNEHHVREHSRGELDALLSPVFPKSVWYAQRLQFNSVLWAMQLPLAGRYGAAQSCGMHPEALTPVNCNPDGMYFFVVCGSMAANLPKPPDLCLFADTDGAVLKQYEQLMSWQWEAKDQMIRLDAAKSHLESQLKNCVDQHHAEVASQTDRLNRLQIQIDDLARASAEADRERLLLHNQVESLRDQLNYRSSLIGWLKLPLHRLRRLFGS